MLRAVVLVLVGLLFTGACGEGEDSESDTIAAPSTEPRDEPVVIQTLVTVAPTSGSEPAATGEVLEGSTLGGAPFCVGGTILDSHANLDPAVEPAACQPDPG